MKPLLCVVGPSSVRLCVFVWFYFERFHRKPYLEWIWIWLVCRRSCGSVCMKWSKNTWNSHETTWLWRRVSPPGWRRKIRKSKKSPDVFLFYFINNTDWFKKLEEVNDRLLSVENDLSVWGGGSVSRVLQINTSKQEFRIRLLRNPFI